MINYIIRDFNIYISTLNEFLHNVFNFALLYLIYDYIIYLTLNSSSLFHREKYLNQF